jgi:hypothetical protein
MKTRGENVLALILLDLDGYLFTGRQSELGTEVKRGPAADFTGWETDNAKFKEQFERRATELGSGLK